MIAYINAINSDAKTSGKFFSGLSTGLSSSWSLMVLICLFHSQIAVSADSTTRFTATASYIDNVGLASADADKISDTLLEITAERTYRQTIGISQTIFYGFRGNVRDYQDYPCDRFDIGLLLGYEKKLGLGFDKPRLTLLWNGSKSTYAEDSLNAFNSELSLGLSRPVGEYLDISARVIKNWQIPDRSAETFGLPDSANGIASNALDQETTGAEISAEYYATANWSFPVSISYIDGDLDSVARLNPQAVNYADAIANDEGLGPDWFVFRAKGQAWSGTLAASRILNDGSELNIEYSHTDAKTRGNIRYDQRALTIAWTKNW